MAAFDRICSGLPQLDEALDCIRLGDNVVWQISELEEFRAFAEPFARQAVRDGRNVIYIRLQPRRMRAGWVKRILSARGGRMCVSVKKRRFPCCLPGHQA